MKWPKIFFKQQSIYNIIVYNFILAMLYIIYYSILSSIKFVE